MDDEVPSERVIAAVVTAFTPTTDDDGEPDRVRFTVEWRRAVEPEDKHIYIGLLVKTAALEMCEHLPDVPPMYRDEIRGQFLHDVHEALILLRDNPKEVRNDRNECHD